MSFEARTKGDLPVASPETASEHVGDDATMLVSGFGSVGYPKLVPETLAESGRDLSLAVVSGGSVGEEIDVALVEADAMARRYPFQARDAIREAINAGEVAFADRHISTLGDDVQFGGMVDPDIAVVEAVSVGEDWLVPSTSLGLTPAFIESADELIVEVNTAQPRALEQFHDVYRPEIPPNREPIPLSHPGERIGDARIQFDPAKLSAVVETDRRDVPYEFRDPTETDLEIAANLGAFMEREVDRSPLYEESVRLQFGVGSLGNALMRAIGDADLGDRDLIYYGEVIQDGLLDLLDDGKLEAASATSLALSAEGQTRLFESADRYAEDVLLRPGDVSNRASLIDRFGVVAINSAVGVDLYGHVNSTNVNGSRLISGIGGSGDFTRNAPLSIIALPSTAAGGEVSRIVPMVPHVDHTEHDLDVVVTEHGVADLRGLSPRERARELRECAAPSFRSALDEYLDRATAAGGHVPHDLETVFDWTDGE
ncbi:acetyl-CoA hydrolase/transferase C-terminal domain-containing protein [Halosegnis longus]|uniref:acetyl-CoA hydrolase/transferase C-terminal domain-containing protein n=1 Tax=Halosegnis longus TaxID=2216012 RepID=UPI00268AA15F